MGRKKTSKATHKAHKAQKQRPVQKPKPKLSPLKELAAQLAVASAASAVGNQVDSEDLANFCLAVAWNILNWDENTMSREDLHRPD